MWMKKQYQHPNIQLDGFEIQFQIQQEVISSFFFLN